MYRTQVRLSGIDCAEIKGKNLEKVRAIAARDALSAKILHKVVRLENCSSEKYGRLLAEIWYGDENINQWMLSKGHAVPYDGKAKTFNWDGI
jgi:endonuclease YncB( thermonuclease family)